MKGSALLLLIAAMLLFLSISQIVLHLDGICPRTDAAICHWEDGSFSFRDPETGCGQGDK